MTKRTTTFRIAYRLWEHMPSTAAENILEPIRKWAFENYATVCYNGSGCYDREYDTYEYRVICRNEEDALIFRLKFGNMAFIK